MPTSTRSSDDSRAVSQVIGIVLLMAMALVLATVIGAFATGIGEQSLQTQPHAAIHASDADGVYNDSQPSEFAILAHASGDGFTLGETEILIRTSSDGTHIDTWRGSWENGYFQPLSPSSEMHTGSRITLATTASGANATIPDATEYRILIVHEETGTVIAKDRVDVR